MRKEYKENFELWAQECVRITDKLTGRPVAFRLNGPQRRVLGMLEDMRRRREPIRLIMLKARQWGGSTLIQVYMAWIQLVRRRGWNSLICAHVKDASAQIRGMYSLLLREYPEGMKEGQTKDWAFVPYEKSQSVSWIPAREAQVAIATSLSPNTVRGSNFAMAHLSEVAFWGDGDPRLASEIVRTVSGSVAREPETLVVMESTANGTGNYFHSEWQRAVAGRSDKIPVFVGWQEIDIYRRSVAGDERERILSSLDEYEQGLLGLGIELERVAWYHEKRREYPTHEAMMAEFPTTPEEAFANSCAERLMRPDHVPEAESGIGTTAELLAGVLLVSSDGSGQILTQFGKDSAGRLVPVSDEPMDGLSLGRAVREATARCVAAGVPMIIAEVRRGSEPVHLPWCARQAERSGAALSYDDDESGVALLDGSVLAACADSYAGLAEEGLVGETSVEARQELLRCRRDHAWQTPLALTRLVAAGRYAAGLQPRVSYADFSD